MADPKKQKQAGASSLEPLPTSGQGGAPMVSQKTKKKKKTSRGK